MKIFRKFALLHFLNYLKLLRRKEMKEERQLQEFEFLTRRESARFLRISIASFDKIKDIACIRYGKSKRFSIEELRRYALRHTEGGQK
jgi:hypothetical protein